MVWYGAIGTFFTNLKSRGIKNRGASSTLGWDLKRLARNGRCISPIKAGRVQHRIVYSRSFRKTTVPWFPFVLRNLHHRWKGETGTKLLSSPEFHEPLYDISGCVRSTE